MYSCIITVCENTDYSHLPLYQFCMCTLRLLPSALVALLYVHTQTRGIYSYPFSKDKSLLNVLNYNHPLVYYYCMCILRLQPSNLVSLLYLHRLQAHTLLSLLYVHPRTTAIHSCINTVYASSDYNHLFFYHHCMCILRLQPSILVS